MLGMSSSELQHLLFSSAGFLLFSVKWPQQRTDDGRCQPLHTQIVRQSEPCELVPGLLWLPGSRQSRVAANISYLLSSFFCSSSVYLGHVSLGGKDEWMSEEEQAIILQGSTEGNDPGGSDIDDSLQNMNCLRDYQPSGGLRNLMAHTLNSG